jgi:hypothetical protein
MVVPVKSVTEEKSPYAVNRELFSESAQVKEKMELIEKRLQKMEEHRREVSDSVYLKVKADYEIQLDEVREAFQEKCREIEKELQQLYRARTAQEETLSEHEEVLEEAKFRRTLGEYSEKKYKEIESKENKDIKQYKDVLEVIKGSIQQYEEILGRPFSPGSMVEEEVSVYISDEEDSEPEYTPAVSGSPLAGKAKPVKTPVAGAKPPPQQTRAPTDAELDSFLETEGDYFSSQEDSEISEIQAEDEETRAVETQAVPRPSVFNPPFVSTTQPDDDSISNILRDIPFEETTGEPEAKTKNELTGTHDVPVDTKANIMAPPQEASLLLLEGELEEHEYILSENTSIGRSPANDVVLKESKISRQHANINYLDGHYVLTDLKSSNGVFVNGKKTEESILKDGDEISIGSFKFQFNLL